MRPVSGLSVAFAILACSAAIEITNGVVDEDHEAIVVEAFRNEPENSRRGRQFPIFSGEATSPLNGMYPASTYPISSGTQMALCRSPTGMLTFCGGNYQWGGARVPQQYPGLYPGQPPLYPGAGWGQPQPPQQQYPGWPPQIPPVPTHPPTQVQPGWPQPAPVQPAPVQPAPVQPAPVQPAPVQPAPVAPDTEPVIVESPEENLPSGASPGQCGVGRYYPIRYNKDGVVAEEQERIDGAGSKVVNGWPADKGEWPWIAALLNNGRQFCGGSLITRKHILTAAHCVAHMSRYDVANLKVRLGEHAIKQVGETNLFESKAARVVRHKGFSQQTLHKDVAVITLEDEVPPMDNVRPVCLDTMGGDKYVDQHATVVGWGSLKENGPQPDILQEVTVRIWDNKVCKETYGPAAPGGIMDHMLCAGREGKDSCSGDSGGPMQIGSGSTWTQIGVVSWGIGCGKSHYPGVYSRISMLRDWIDKITRDY